LIALDKNKIWHYYDAMESETVKQVTQAAVVCKYIEALDNCDVCGVKRIGHGNKSNIIAHHVCYSMPFFVSMLCRSCHTLLHVRSSKNENYKKVLFAAYARSVGKNYEDFVMHRKKYKFNDKLHNKKVSNKKQLGD